MRQATIEPSVHPDQIPASPSRAYRNEVSKLPRAWWLFPSIVAGALIWGLLGRTIEAVWRLLF